MEKVNRGKSRKPGTKLQRQDYKGKAWNQAMKRLLTIFGPFLILVSSAIFLLTTSCVVGDGGIHVRGNVGSEIGQPLKATIAFTKRGGREFSEETDPSGTFDISHTVAPGHYDYTVTVSANGFKPYKGKVRTRQFNICKIILVPLDSSTSSVADCTVEKPSQ